MVGPDQGRRASQHRQRKADAEEVIDDHPRAVPVVRDGIPLAAPADGDGAGPIAAEVQVDGEGVVPEQLDPERDSRLATLAASMLALTAPQYRAAVAAAGPGTVPAEVLVRNVRALMSSGRPDDAHATVTKLMECRTVPGAEPGAGRGLADMRYTYLSALRYHAMRTVPVPDRQGWQLDEDLFQDAVERILRTLHTNASAGRNWAAFCYGRLVDVHRERWGKRKGRSEPLPKAGFEVPAADHTEDDRVAHDRSEVEISDAGNTVERDDDGGAVSGWAWVVDFARDLFENADPVLRAVADDQWLSPGAPSSLLALARRLDVKYDRLINIRLEAQTRLVAALMAQTDRPINREMLKRTLDAIPPKRGSRKKSSGPTKPSAAGDRAGRDTSK